MQCSRCQAENRAGRRYCGECGAALSTACPCGFVNEPGERFCGGCGSALTTGASATASGAVKPATGPSPTPGVQATPPTPVSSLTSRDALEGERKQVTVLFADIKGSLEMLEGRDPEEARQILDPALHAMCEAVHRYGGTVNNRMGDGIMALFGAPLALEDHAVRACYAGLAMQSMIRSYTDQVRRAHGLEMLVRVGLNSGEVVVRAVGSDLHMDYSAIGQTTHLASRMEQLALPGTIRLTAETVSLAEGFIQVRSLGPVPVKGLRESVEVFELLGAEPTRRRLRAGGTRGLGPFVGREAELGTLSRALEQSGAGHGQIVALVGEPGVGKSRLYREFTGSQHTLGWVVLEAGSVSYGKATPFLPVADLVKSYLQLDSRDDSRKVREKVTGKILTLDESLKPTLPAFFTLLEVPFDDPEWQALDPPARRQRTLEAVKRLLLRESQEQPLCVVFEDLHWIDSETQALLEILVESLPTARLLLLVNYRPEYQHEWGGKTYYTQLRIDPLAAESAEELLRGLLGEGPELEPVKQLLIQRTEGNPFFLEESVRGLIDAKVLAGERGAYRLTKAVTGIRVPATVQAVLAARIDRLPAEEKRLLQSASVIGKDVAFTLLHAVAELPDDSLRRGLAHLQAAEFLYETSLFPELEYTFKHALTHEVAYGGLLQERRRALHARIVEAIELLYADRLAEQVNRLAHHAFRGEVWDKALAYLRRAGARAAARSANREAVTLFEQALVALEHLPDSREKAGQAVDLRFDLRNSLVPLGEPERLLEHLRQAEELARRLNDDSRLGRVSSYLTNYFWQMGDYDRAIEAGQRALEIGGRIQDPALQAAAAFYLGQAHFNAGDYQRAADFNRRNVEALGGERTRERFGQSALLVLSHTWLTWALTELGEFHEGIVRAEEGARIAEAIDQPFILIHAYIGLGGLHLRKGELDRAIPALERCRAIMETWDFPVFFSAIAPPLGYAYALAGRLAEALPLLKQAVEHAVSAKLMAAQALRVAWLSEAYLLAGRIDEADALAPRALELAREHKERGYEAWTLRLLAEISSRREPTDVEKAGGLYREAIGRAEELGMGPLVAQSRLGLGRLYGRTGNHERAQAELSEATRLFRAMEMEFWLPVTEVALASR